MKRKLVGQRGEDLVYDGWPNELQDDLRRLRDRRIATDLDFGVYGDAHSELILACTNEEFLAKVKLFIEGLSDEERQKPELQVEVEPSDEPPMYEEATVDMTEEEKEAMNKQAEKNLLDLQEKLRLLEEQLEKEERSKLTKISEETEEQTEVTVSESEKKVEETAPEVPTESEQPKTESEATEKSDEQQEEPVEKEDNDANNQSEDLVVCEEAPVEPVIESEVKQESGHDNQVEIESETNTEPSEAELAESIEKKEKEALQIANETIQFVESQSDLPPTYEETTSVPIASIDVSQMTPKPEKQMPTIPAICAFFYTGEIIVSKRNYEELREYGIKLNIEAFGRASEEFVNMMGPDADEENDVGTMRYKFRDVPLTSNLVLSAFDAVYRSRRSVKPEELEKLDNTDFCVYRSEEIHRLLLSATCELLCEKVELEIPAETDQAVLKRLIEFIYTGKIPNLTQTMGREVLILAKRLGFTRLIRIIVDWLMNRIKADNCIELQLLGVDHEIKPLAERARHFVLRNFKDVTKTESFKELPGSWLSDYVEDDLVEVDFPADKGELLLFQQCKKWAEAHPVERVNEFADIILRAIRFELISANDLINVVSKDGMVLDNKMATNHIANIIEYKNQSQVPNGRLRGSEAVIIAGGSVPIIDDTKGGVYEGEDHHVYDSSILGKVLKKSMLTFRRLIVLELYKPSILRRSPPI